MAATLTGRSLSKYLYRPDGWDDAWRTAKAASSSTPAILAGIGDSVLSGYNASAWQTTSWFNLLRAQLGGLYGIAGDFWNITYNPTFESALSASGNLPFTIAANGGPYGYGFGNIYAWTNAQFTNPAWTFDSSKCPTGACTQLDLIAIGSNAARTFTMALDSVNQAATNCAALDVLQKTSYTGLANTTHTLAYVAQSNDFSLEAMGVSAWKSTTSGIFFVHQGFQGSGTGDWYPRTFHPPDKCMQWQGTTGASTNTTGFGAPTQPHLAIIALGINDCTIHTGLNQYEQALRRLCQALRRGRQNCSVLFVINSNPDLVSSDVTSGFGDPQNYPLYIDRVYRVAQAFRCAVANVHAKWADQGVALGFQMAGQAHPNDAGHADMFTLVGSIV